MALQHLLDISSNRKKIGLSEERLEPIKPALRQYIAYWREYPDMFIDFLQTGENGKIPDSGLHFYFYQRVFLRAAMRYKYVYFVFPRAYSKSFLSVLTLMIRCILYPRAKLFVTSGGKEQAAGIIKEKVDELCALVPALDRELDRRPGQTRQSKDYCIFKFKSGSYFDNLAATEKSRGKRRHGGLMEECVGIDGTILNEVIIPIMNVSRLCMDGTMQQDETLNKSQIYVTTAGWKGTFAYDKLIQLLVRMIVEPEKAFIMGGTWRIPVLMKLLDRSFLQDLQRDGTYNEASFDREYESKWSGTAENAFFNGEIFDRNRILKQPEYEHSGRSSLHSYYVLSVDVGRKGCDSVICVWKVTPQSAGPAIKSLVNIYTMDDAHFQDQAIKLKRLYYKYKARRLVIDANGIGIGLVDYMVKSQNDEVSGEHFPDFGVYGGTQADAQEEYKKYRTNETEEDAMYLMKASAPINSEAHANAQTQMNAGKVKLLIDERVAKVKLLDTVAGKKMTPEKRAEYLKPFTLTSILKEEMMNLREENEGINIILKQANKGIKKDKFSAFEYGLYYIKMEEESKKKKKKFKITDMMFSN